MTRRYDSDGERRHPPELSRRDMLHGLGGSGIILAGIGYGVKQIIERPSPVPVDIIERKTLLGGEYVDSVDARVDEDISLPDTLSLSFTLTERNIRRPLERIDVYTADGTGVGVVFPDGKRSGPCNVRGADLPAEYRLAFRLPNGPGGRTRLAELIRIRAGSQENTENGKKSQY